MVFVHRPFSPLVLGLIGWRESKYTIQLIIETIFGLVVALANILIIIVFISGWRRLMKNNVYVILANLAVCTSLKAVVELAFVVPYYIIQIGRPANQKFLFSTTYERLVFNTTVLADYGVLFFSLLLAVNRLFVVLRFIDSSRSSEIRERMKTALSCCAIWLTSFIIPVLYFILDCQYVYQSTVKLYINECFNAKSESLRTLLQCLIYTSYVCTIIVLLIYSTIFIVIRKQRTLMSTTIMSSRSSKAEIQLLKHSVAVFLLYAASILCVFLLSASEHLPNLPKLEYFDIAYAENLLNLSISAVYPICFLAMSGEMKSILILKLVPRGSWMVSSISTQSSSSNPRSGHL